MTSKKKLNSLISLDKAKMICQSNGIKVYPISIRNSWYIQISINGKIKTFDKEIGSGATLNSKTPIHNKINWVKAIEQTIIFYANKTLNYE